MHKKTKPLVLAAAVIIALGALLLTLTVRPQTRFSGDRTAGPEGFSLRFDMMDKTDVQTLSLSEGDRLRVTWRIDGGSADILVRKKDGEVLYRADGRTGGDTADFELTVPETGEYTITVTARKAKGQIEFAKE